MQRSKLFLLFFFSFFGAFAQDVLPAPQVICLAEEGTFLSEIPAEILPKNVRTNAANFLFTYDTSVPAEAKPAIEKAASIWSNLLASQIPIHIKVTWQNITGTTLAVSGATKIYRNFTGATYQNIWYPVALAEALANKELNSGEDEITMNINSKYTWNYATDGKAVAGKYDLVSIALHELAHGLGFSGTFDLNSSNAAQGQWGQSNYATIFDTFLQDAKGQLLTNTAIYGNPSADLKTAITNNSLFFGLKNAKFKNNFPKLFAPITYNSGSSVSHFDETTYPIGNANSLMSPSVKSGEVIQTVGDILQNIMFEMGWYVYNLNVTITGTENLPQQNFETKVFPNPSTDLLFVAIPDNGVSRNIKLELINQKGQILQVYEEENILARTLEIPIADLATGIYFLRISDKFQVVTKRFVRL